MPQYDSLPFRMPLKLLLRDVCQFSATSERSIEQTAGLLLGKEVFSYHGLRFGRSRLAAKIAEDGRK